jgi:hypothetical protein
VLRAILHGKAGRVTIGGVDLSWRELFRQREDLLTSVFFGRLPYLSPEAIGEVLALLVSKETNASGEFEDMTFWPKLPGGDGRRFVEPDVLIEFEHATVLVEVKLPAGGAQSFSQWRNELRALLEYQAENAANAAGRDVHFVALGRNAPDWKQWKDQLEREFAEAGVRVHAVEWEQVGAGVMALSGATYSSRDKAIFSDWLEAFSLYGLLERARPFDDLLNIRPGILHGWESAFEEYPALRISHNWKPLSELAATFNLRSSAWQ